MKRQTINQLLALNRKFYATFADAFADSRPVTDPTVTAILPYVPERANALDLGCGNGRLARLLARKRPQATYVGLDAEPALIKRAREQARHLKISVAFHVADITRLGWHETFPPEHFDCATILAVLHHVPSFDLRAAILRDTAGLVTPKGRLIVSTWQFLTNARMRRKIVDWDEVGISQEALEPDDYLLDWKRGGRGLRYCHMIDEEEMERLATVSGLHIRETFRAGGREGDLSLFAVLEHINLPSQRP